MNIFVIISIINQKGLRFQIVFKIKTMRFIQLIFIVIILICINQIFCADGVGDTILKELKTTTPLRRPQKNGYFLNFH